MDEKGPGNVPDDHEKGPGTAPDHEKGPGNAPDHGTSPETTTQSTGKIQAPRSKPLPQTQDASEDREDSHVDWMSSLSATAEGFGLTWGEHGSSNALTHDTSTDMTARSSAKSDEPMPKPLPRTHDATAGREHRHVGWLSSESTTTQEVDLTSNTATERERSSDSLQQAPAKRAAVNTSRADVVPVIKKYKSSTESLVDSWGSVERIRYPQADDGHPTAYWGTSTTTSGRSQLSTKNITETGSQAMQTSSPIVDHNYISRAGIRSKIVSTGESSSKSDGSSLIDPWDYSRTNTRRIQKQEQPVAYPMKSNMHERTGSSEFVSMDGGISMDETSYVTTRDNLDDGMSLVEDTSKWGIPLKSQEPVKQMPETDDEVSFEAKTSMHAERSDRGKVGIVLYLDDESVSTFSDETKDTSMDDSKCSYRSAELEQPNATGKARKHICRICGHRKGKHRLSSKQKDRAREIIRKSKAANGGRHYVEPDARIEREESHDDDDDGVLTEGHEVKSTSSLLQRSPRGAFLDKFSIAEMHRDLDIRSELFSKRGSKRTRQGHSKDAAKPITRSGGSRQMKTITKGTTISIPFKASVNGFGGDAAKDDTPRERNIQDGAETRMIPIQDQATDGRFIYSKRDNDMPLAESRHYGFADVDDDQDNTDVMKGDKPQDSMSKNEVGSSLGDIGYGLGGNNSISCSLRNFSSPDYSLLNYISDGAMTVEKTQDSTSQSKVGSSQGDIGEDFSGSSITCSLRKYSSPDYSLLNYISDGVMKGDINNTEVIQSKRDHPVHDGRSTSTHIWSNDDEVIPRKLDHPVLDGRSTSTHIWSNDDKSQDSITCSVRHYSSPDYSLLNYISDGAMRESVNSYNVGESVIRRAISCTRRHDLSPDFSFHNYNSHDVLSHSVSSLTGAEVGRMSSRIIENTDFKGVKRLEDKAMSSFDVVKKTIHISVGGRSRSEQFSRASQFQTAWIEAMLNQQVQHVHYPRNTDALTPRVDTYSNASADQSISTLVNFIHAVCGNTTVNIWSDDSNSEPPRKAPIDVAHIQPEVSTKTSVLSPSYGNRTTSCGDVRESSIMTSTCDLTDTIPGSDLIMSGSTELPSGKPNSSGQNDIAAISLNQPEHGSTSSKELMVSDSPENDVVVPLVLSRNPNVLTKPQDAATVHALRSNKPPEGTPMVTPCKDTVEVVNATGTFDTPSIWLNKESKTDSRRASTQSDTIDAKFVYSRRDHTIPLAASSNRLFAGYDNTIDGSPEYGYVGPSRMRGTHDVPTRRHTVHGKKLPREENNAVVGETGAPFYRRNTIGATEDRGRIKQGHTNVLDISKQSRPVESKLVEKRHEYDIEVTHSSRDPYTPDKLRIRKTSDNDETLFLYSKRDHSIPLAESTHDRFSDDDNNVNTASSENSVTGHDDCLSKNVSDRNSLNQMERRSTSSQESISDLSQGDYANTLFQQRKGDDISGEHAIASAYGQHDNMIRELKTILTPYRGIIPVVSETNVSDAASHVDSSNEEYDGNRTRSQNDANTSDVIQSKRDHPVLDHRSTSTHIRSSDDAVNESKRDHPVIDHRSTSTHIWSSDDDVLQSKRDDPVLDHRSTSTHIWSSEDDVLQSKLDLPVPDNRSTSTHIWSSNDDVLQSKRDDPVLDHRSTSTHIWSSDDDVLQSKRDDPVLETCSTSTHIWLSDDDVLQSKLDLPVPDNRSTSTHIWLSDDDVLQSKLALPVPDHRSTSTHIWSNDNVLQSKRDNPILDDRSTSTHISLDDRSTSTHIWPSDDETVLSKRDHPVLDERSTSTHDVWLDDRSTSTHIWPSDDGTVLSKPDHPVLDNRSTSTHIWSTDYAVIQIKRDDPVLDSRSTSTHIWSSDDDVLQSKRDDPVLDHRSTSTHIWSSDDDVLQSKRDDPVLDHRSTSTHIWSSDESVLQNKRDAPVLNHRSTSTHIWSSDDNVLQSKRDDPVLDHRSTSTHIWSSNDDVLQSKRDDPVLDHRSTSTHIWSSDESVLQNKRDDPVLDQRSTSTHIWSSDDYVLQSKRDHPALDIGSKSTHIWSNYDVLQSKRDHPVLDNRGTSTHIWSSDDGVLQSKRDHPALDIRSTSTHILSSYDGTVLSKRDHPVFDGRSTRTHIWSNDEDVLQSKRDDAVLDIGSTSTHSLLNAVEDLRSKSDHSVPGDRNTGVQSATNNVELSSSECGRLMVAVAEASRLPYRGPDSKTVLTPDTELNKNATSLDHRRQNEFITETVYEEEHPSTTSYETKSDSHLYDSNSRSLQPKSFDVQMEDLQQTKSITTSPQIEVTPASNSTLTSSKGSMADVNKTSGSSRHTRSTDISRSNIRRDISTVEASHVKLYHSEEHMTSTSYKSSEVDAPSSNESVALVESIGSTISKGHNTSAPIPTHDIEASMNNAPEQLVVTLIEDSTGSRPDRTAIMGHSDHSTTKNVDAASRSHDALEDKDVSMSDFFNTSSRKHSVPRRDSGGRSTVSYMDQHCRTMVPQDWHTENRRKTITGVLPCPDHYISIGETAVRNMDDFTAAVRGNARRTLSASSHSSASSQSSRHGTETQTSYSGSDVHDSASMTHSASSEDVETAPTSLEPISELPNVERNRVMSDIDEKQEVRMSISGVRTHQSPGVLDVDVGNRLRAVQHATTTGDTLHLKSKSVTEYLGLFDDVTFKQTPSADTAGIAQRADKPAQNTDGTNTICTYASDPVTVEVWRLPSHYPMDASTGDDVSDVGTRLESSTSGNLAVLLRDLTPESTQLEIAESAERILQRMLEVSACNFTVSSSSLACNVICGRR